MLDWQMRLNLHYFLYSQVETIHTITFTEMFTEGWTHSAVVYITIGVVCCGLMYDLVLCRQRSVKPKKEKATAGTATAFVIPDQKERDARKLYFYGKNNDFQNFSDIPY